MAASFLNPINYNLCRTTMINTQLYPNGIHDDCILKAFHSVPREKFLPIAFQSQAYSDGIIQINKNILLFPPLWIAYFLDAMKINSSDSILIIGDQIGYTTALFSFLGGDVVLLIPSNCPSQVHFQIQENLENYAAKPVIIKKGDLKKGVPSQSPYTHIFVDGGSIPALPEAYKFQMEEKGEIGVFLRKTSSLVKACVFQKIKAAFNSKILFDTICASSPEFHETPVFSF